MVARRLEPIVVAVLEAAGRWLWGFQPRLIVPIVERLGPVGSLGWFLWNMPRYQWTLRRFGGLRTHLLCVAISLVNGCAYCTFGHAYALELTYLRDQGRLFPLDEQAIGQLAGLPPATIRRLVDALQDAHLHAEVRWLDCVFALTAGGQLPTDRDDVRIAHLVRMFGVLNSVGSASRILPGEAYDPLNRDDVLKRRYATLRAAPGT